VINDLIDKAKKELSKLKHKRFWSVVISLIFLSGIIAVANDGKPDSAWREMAAGAFSGGIIGLIILWYEQLRESEREKAQVQRDIEQAKRLQNEIDSATNIRYFADQLLTVLIPTYEKTIEEVNNSASIRITYGPFAGRAIPDMISKGSVLVERINDYQLTEKWEKFDKALLELLNLGLKDKTTNQKPNMYDQIIVELQDKLIVKKEIDTSLEQVQKYLEQKLYTNNEVI